MNIVFPELNNPIIKQAIAEFNAENAPDSATPVNGASLGPITPVPADSLVSACELAKSADALIAGIDYTTRDVVLACKERLGTSEKTFSSCFVMQKATPETTASTPVNLPRTLILADAGVTKNPTADQLYDIVLETYATSVKILDETPKIALLSFSTLGSARDESIDKLRFCLEKIRAEHPEIIIDGELQLDAAVNKTVAAKKAPSSPVAGEANVLIVPDLNSGNILYKSLEQFGGYTAAGPILQGFTKPCSDLSRGSTVEDVKLVIRTVQKLAA